MTNNRLPEFLVTSNGINISKHIKPKDYPLHSHDFFELEYIVSGEGTLYINNIAYDIKPGMLCFFTPVDFEQIAVKSTVTIINLMFREEWVENEIISNLNSPAVIYDYNFPLSERLLSEYENNEKYNYLTIKYMLNLMLVDVSRHLRSNAYTDKLRIPKNIRAAIVYIQLHYKENISLEEVSAHAFLAPAYLSKIFKEYMGIGFSKYLINLRLRHACNLLRNSDSSVTDICFSSGFSSFSHFLRCFKQRFNISPREYRKSKDTDFPSLAFEEAVEYHIDGE